MTKKEITKKLSTDILDFINLEDPSVRVLDFYINDWLKENNIEVKNITPLLDPQEGP